ncbi:MAG: hypothetical protein F6J95_001915 [Leptolyngbya sp. SIO1E4]|nr:hypothetical protein [Leptolyngbya sp. SIO1E4]
MKDLLPNTETYTLSPNSAPEPDSLDASDSSDLPDLPDEPSPLNNSDSPNDPAPMREPIHIILIGSTVGVKLVVGVLHSLGFAEPRAWSKPQIDPNSGKPMRILTKWMRY